MTKRRLFALLLVVVLAFSLAACGKKSDTGEPGTSTPGTSTPGTSTPGTSTPGEKPSDKVLVVGVDGMFDGKWNPFLVESAYDHQIVDQVFAAICQINADNELEPYAGNITAEEMNGGVMYTVTIEEGMTFTDGTPVTIDDYIYGFYVRADPSYTGPGSLLTSDIEGIKEYYYDNANYSADIAAFEAEAAAKYAYDVISYEDFFVYAEATNLEGWWNGDPAGDVGNGENWSWYAELCGYEAELAEIDATSADEMFALIVKIEYETCPDAYNSENWYLTKMKADYAAGNISDGVTVPEISGIKKIDEYTCTIFNTVVDIYADRGLTTQNGQGNIVPRHYYGEVTKGDVSKILANIEPMGSGPYIWGGFADNIATATANVNFFLGVPKTGTVRWQYIPTNDIMAALASGSIDIANPTSSKENVAEMQTLGLRYDLIDNAGYGYMAMNTERVPLLVRKGIWHLMNRGPSVEGYYGTELAAVIERPMTTTLAEYPDDATEYYGYSREKAMEYFTQAGYSNVNGSLVDANGNKLVVACFIGGGGQGAHPAYAMLVQAAADMEALGGEIQIQDVEFNVLTGAVDAGTADMWIMAWSAVYDCDKTAQFHTNGGQNNYKFSDPAMDALLEQIPRTIDLDARRELVSQMLDLAMENCIEFPLYQRKNMMAYNSNTLDLDTIPQATTAADYQNSLWQVVVK